MPGYKIFETDQFKKELQRVASLYEEKLIQRKLEKQIYPQLRQQPYYGNNIKKLRDYEPETWRYRIGNFRLFYSVDEKAKVVIIATIRLRKEAYRK